jgi:chromosome segregation ATPase
MQETLTNACDESLPTSRSAPEGLEDITATLKSLQEEKETAQREAEQKAQQVLILEQELNASKKDLGDAEEAKKLAIAEKERLQSQLDDSQAKITTLIAENEVLTREKSELVNDADLARSMAASAKTKAEDAEKTIADLRQSLGAGADSSRGVAPEVDTPLPQPSDDNDDVVSTASSAGKQHQQQDKQQDHTSISIEEFRSLQKTLAETSSSLETSKKIIASMESANGSLAVDMRSKLKAKEEELANVQKESDERKRRLDSLATELRDLQNKYGDVEEADRRIKSQLIKQRALMGHLESSLSDLQSAVVVYESSGSNMDEIAEILGDTLYAVTLTLNATEQFVDDYDDASVAHTEVSLKSDVGRHIDAIIRNDREAAARDLRKELDQKKIAVKRLEEALKKQNEEMKKLRSQSEGRSRPPSGDDTDELKAEIENLRKQVSTNLEVLANKERELHVLRSSLKVDDNDAGYISDDASDDDEDEGDQQSTYSSPARLNGYSPADAEALATILSQTNGSMDGSVRARELESLRKDLSKIKSEKEKFEKDLKEERESLASAKMIISSLENANKQMMEDLRSRLQDSNAAIAALLDKSMEHEKTSEKLKEELDLLNKEREAERKRYEAELKKMQIQNGSASQNGDLELINEAKTQDNELPCEEKKEELFVSPLSHDEPAMQLL